jgi:hypothetical protein
MLWFRNENDFSDWLNNPYHDQATRNYLIKLAVNFVHDLYKPNVRGYQVTQCRTKAYGNKMVRQFKLERWMDYGPTIAAAFGSYDPKEVDDLRAAIVECMRNTPLNSGIRATGAVRQQSREEEDDRSHDGVDDDTNDDDRRGRSKESQDEAEASDVSEAAEEEEKDLLDVGNWDDAPSQGSPTSVPYGQQPPPGPGQSYGGPQVPQQPPQYGQQPPPFGQQAVPPQQYGQQVGPPQQFAQQPPQQQAGYHNALVPVSTTPGAYPGAQQPFGQPQYPPQQQPPYAGSPPQYHQPTY